MMGGALGNREVEHYSGSRGHSGSRLPLVGLSQEEALWRGLLQTRGPLPRVQETRRSLTPGAGRGWPVWQLSQAFELSSWLNTERVSSRRYNGRGEGCWETQAGAADPCPPSIKTILRAAGTIATAPLQLPVGLPS